MEEVLFAGEVDPSNGGKNCRGWIDNTAILQGLISNMQNR